MSGAEADFAVERINTALSQLEAHRADAERYAGLAEELLANLKDAATLMERSDTRLEALERRLMREFVFAAKSAQLRGPASSVNGGAGSGERSKTGY